MEGIENSCNPVFIEIGLRLGTENFYKYFRQFGLMGTTGVDLPGEAGTIMHKMENVGQVELATMSFGQSFQVTPVQMAATVSSLVNGGTRVTPHFGLRVLDEEGKELKEFQYQEKERIVSEETSRTMQRLLEGWCPRGPARRPPGGVSHRREDCHLPDPPKKRQPVYIFFHRFRAGQRPADPGDVRDLRSPGSLLRRDYRSAGDRGHFP